MPMIVNPLVNPETEVSPSTATLLELLAKLERQVAHLEQRSADLEAGIVRMATYQGVLHVLKETGPK
jgi:hypothetical protein